MSRHGMAMLIVLACSVVLLSAAAVVARARSTASITRSTAASFTIALEVAAASDAAALAWLGTESRLVVLDPSTPAPFVEVANNRLRIATHDVDIQITAWDQTGMVPCIDLADFSQLAREARDAGTEGRWVGSAHPGLDLAEHEREVFPSRTNPQAPGGIFATHNPSPGSNNRRGGQAASINVNTMPEPMLRAIFRDLNITGIEPILADRRRGSPAALNGLGSQGGAPIRLSASSIAWGIRTDILISGPGGARVSVWSIYTLRGGAWVQEQRVGIPE